MNAVSSKGIKFEVSSTSKLVSSSYQEVTGLYEIPDIGGTPEKIEITTLADSERHYIQGLRDFGDLNFNFIFNDEGLNKKTSGSWSSNFESMKALEDATDVNVKVYVPDCDGTFTTFAFDADIAASMSGKTYNEAITFAVNTALKSAVTVAYGVSA